MRLFEGTQWDRPPHCELCGMPEAECRCPPATEPVVSPATQTARLAIEKRRKGKAVTLVRGLKSAETDLRELLTQLKTGCGAGGTLQDETIEIQGRQLDRVREILEGIGYRVRG